MCPRLRHPTHAPKDPAEKRLADSQPRPSVIPLFGELGTGASGFKKLLRQAPDVAEDLHGGEAAQQFEHLIKSNMEKSERSYW